MIDFTLVLVFRPEAATPSHVEGVDYDHDPTDPFDGIEVLCAMPTEEAADAVITEFQKEHSEWKFCIVPLTVEP